MTIAVQTAGLGLPLKRSVEVTASLGVDGIEIDAREELRPDQLSQTALRQLRKLLADARLRVAAIGFHTRRGYDVAEDLQRRVEATQAAMRMAAQLGAPVVVNRIGSVPEDPQSQRWLTLAEVVTDLGRFGQRHGVRLAAQTGTVPASRLASLLAALPEGTLAVTFDPGALTVAGHSVEESLAILGPHIAHVYATDAKRDSGGRAIETPLGQGSVDYPAFLGGLAEHDYQGALTIGGRGAADPLAAVATGLAALRNLRSQH